MTELAFSGLGVNPITATPPNGIDPDAVPRRIVVGRGGLGGASGWRRRRSGRTPAGRSGCPRRGTTWSGSSRPPAPCRCAASCRCATASTRSGRSPARSRTAPNCTAVLTGDRAPDLRGATVRGLRLLVLDGLPFEDAAEAPVQAFEEAVARLAAAGATIDPRHPARSRARHVAGHAALRGRGVRPVARPDRGRARDDAARSADAVPRRRADDRARIRRPLDRAAPHCGATGPRRSRALTR